LSSFGQPILTTR